MAPAYWTFSKVVHYKSFKIRSHVDKFIITYLTEKKVGDELETHVLISATCVFDYFFYGKDDLYLFHH